MAKSFPMDAPRKVLPQHLEEEVDDEGATNADSLKSHFSYIKTFDMEEEGSETDAMKDCSWRTEEQWTSWRGRDDEVAYMVKQQPGVAAAPESSHPPPNQAPAPSQAAEFALAAEAELLERQAQALRMQAAATRHAAHNAHMQEAFACGYNPYMAPPPWPQHQPAAAPSKQKGQPTASSKASAKDDSTSSKSKPASKAVPAASPADSPENTTVMWRNVPNNYKRDDLLAFIDSEGFSGSYDFFYAPVDFVSEALLGYAFVNFISHEQATRFFAHFQDFDRWSLASQKKSEISWSEPLQGLEGHIERYRNSPVMHPDVSDDKKPLLFQDGLRIAFPEPTKKIRAPHLRGCAQKAKNKK